MRTITTASFSFLLIFFVFFENPVSFASVDYEGEWSSFENIGNDMILSKVAVDKESRTWFLSESEVMVFDGVEWKRFTSQNSGIVDGTYTSIAVSEDGAVWVGSLKGLAKFDGEAWTTYTMDNSELPAKNITGIASDRKGGIWCISYSGLIHFDGMQWAMPPLPSSISGYDLTTIAVDYDYNVWASAYRDGLLFYDGSTVHAYTYHNSKLPSRRVYSVAADPDGNILMGCRGLTVKRGDTWNTFDCDIIQTFAFDSTGLVWAACRNSIICYDGSHIVELHNTTTPLGQTNTIYDIVVDNHDSIWITTLNGVYKYDPHFINIFQPEDNLTVYENSELVLSWVSPGIRTLDIEYSHDAGSTWFSIQSNIDTDTKGFSWTIPAGLLPEEYFTKEISVRITSSEQEEYHREVVLNLVSFMYHECFTSYPPTNSGLPSWSINTIMEDSRGVTWFATCEGLAGNYSDEWENFFPQNSGLLSYTINDCAEDHDGNLWFATGQGLSRYDRNTWETWFEDKPFQHVVVDGSGDVWSVTKEYGTIYDEWRGIYRDIYYSLVYRYDGISMRQQMTAAGDTLGHVSVFDVSPAGEPILYTDDMLMSYNGISWNEISSDDGVYPENPTSLTWDADGNLWTNSYGDAPGLFRHDGNSWTQYTVENSGLTDNNVTFIAADRNNRLWCSTPGDMCVYNGTAWKTYLQEYGWPVGNVKKIFIDRDNVKWFIQQSGVTRFDDSTVSVEDKTVKPGIIPVIGNYPNPFNVSTTVTFSLPSDCRVTVFIYTITGQAIRTLVSENLRTGTYNLTWDGRDDYGNTVSSGVYISRLKTRHYDVIGRMTLVK